MLTARIVLPIDMKVEIETPGGSIPFRLVVLPSGPVRIAVPPLWEFQDFSLPPRQIRGIFSDYRKHGSLRIQFPQDASTLSLRKDADGGMRGTWTRSHSAQGDITLAARADRKRAPVPEGDAVLGSDFLGRWRVRFQDGRSESLCELSALRDGSGIIGTFPTPAGRELDCAGFIRAGRMELFFFDGVLAILIQARLQDDGNITGEWWDSERGRVTWTGQLD